jgi:hypothetical protein
MRGLTSILLAAAFVVSACGSSGASQGQNGQGQNGQGQGAYSLPCGRAEYSGQTGYVWCGTATATVAVDGKRYELPSGLCQPDTALGFTANFGAILSGGQDLAGAPLGLSVAKGNDRDTVSGRFDGHTWAVRGSETIVTIAADKKGGTFSGPTFDGLQVEGTFTCG